MAVHTRHRGASLNERVRAHWEEFKSGKPGRRFQQRYERRQRQGHSTVVKFLYIAVGLVLFAVGLVMLPAAGPGFLVLFPAAALIAEESYLAARAFDWMELKVRALTDWAEGWWKRAPLALKAAIVLVAIVVIGGAGFVAYRVLFA